MEKYGLIEVSGDTITVTNWSKWQGNYSDNPSTMRSRKSREQKRNATHDATESAALHATEMQQTESEENKKENQNQKRCSVACNKVDSYIQSHFGSPTLSAYAQSRLPLIPSDEWQALIDLCKTVEMHQLQAFIDSIGASSDKRRLKYLSTVYQNKLQDLPPPPPDPTPEIERLEARLDEIDGKECPNCHGKGVRPYTEEDLENQDLTIKQFQGMHTGGPYPFQTYCLGDLVPCECVGERENLKKPILARLAALKQGAT